MSNGIIQITLIITTIVACWGDIRWVSFIWIAYLIYIFYQALMETIEESNEEEPDFLEWLEKEYDKEIKYKTKSNKKGKK